MKQFLVTLSLILAVALLAACGGAQITPETPPEIAYGEDVCDHCGMIIEDERFASGVVIQTQPQQYEHRIFDDIGDMLAYVQEFGTTEEIVAYYVHDYASREWIDARHATFVQGEASSTPMGSGLVAFADSAAADEHAHAMQGHVLDFAALHDAAPQEHSHAAHQ